MSPRDLAVERFITDWRQTLFDYTREFEATKNEYEHVTTLPLVGIFRGWGLLRRMGQINKKYSARLTEFQNIAKQLGLNNFRSIPQA